MEIMEINDILKKIGNVLNGEYNRVFNKMRCMEGSYGLNYLKINECAETLLNAVWGKGNYNIPVDIFTLVEKLGIELVFTSLDDDDEEKVNKPVGRMSVVPDFFKGGKNRCIYIDSEIPLFTQRFVVAHELAHLIMDLDNEDWWSAEEDCIMPMLPLKISELIADSFAIFLLIPMEQFFQVFQNYVVEEEKNHNWPIVTEDWLRYLGLKTEMSYCYVAYAYEQIRYVAYWMYENKEKYPFITDEIVTLLYQ